MTRAERRQRTGGAGASGSTAAAGTQPQSSLHRGERAAASAFAALARRLDEVGAVGVIASEDGVAVWTLLLHDDANASARHAVYRWELAVQQDYLEVPIDFRVINAADFPEQRRAELLPSGAQLLYVRSDTASTNAAPEASGDTPVSGARGAPAHAR